MSQDQALGGHLEIADSNSNNIFTLDGKVILSLVPYTGTIWPKITQTKISEHTDIQIHMKEL